MSNLPQGWTVASLGEVIERIDGGKSVKCVERPPADDERGILKVSAVTRGTFEEDESKTVPSSMQIDERARIKAGDLLIARANGTLELVGAAVRVTSISKRLYLSDKILRLTSDAELLPWLHRVLASPAIRRAISDRTSGNAVSMRNISHEALESLPIPVAPLAEQRRILDKLEKALRKTEKCRAHLQRVARILKRFREAVLEAAVSGRLTEEWRSGHASSGPESALPDMSMSSYRETKLPDLPPRWHWSRFGDVAKIESQLEDPSKYPTMPHVAPNHIESWTGRLLPYGTIQSDGVTSGKHLFHSGQVLYSKIRPYLAKAVIVDFDGLCSADMYPLSGTAISSRYLHKWLLTRSFTDFASSNEGRTVLPKINQAALNEIPVPVPPRPEQAEIVRRADDLLAIAARFERQQQAASAVLNRLDPSLLAKAFRGELVPQDPADEPASVLLERMRNRRQGPEGSSSGIATRSWKEDEGGSTELTFARNVRR